MSQKWQSSSALALLALVGVTAIWGWTFLVVQDAVSRMPVMDFLAVRFLLAALVMLVLRPACMKSITRQELKHGVLLGIVLGLGYITQTFGLQHTSAAVSGFITGMFVVLTPVMGWLLLRQTPRRITWLAVILATLGLALLSLHDWRLGPGELLTLACALFFAVHIVGLGAWSPRHDTYRLTLLQLAAVGIIALLTTAPGGVVLPPDSTAWLAVAITAVLATALAFLVQTWAQKLVSPTRAAVVMTMEPVFAGFFAVLIGGNVLTPRIVAGAVCIVAAMLLVELKLVKKGNGFSLD
jgi:drug/metabolite transporter (DMT)-like permease